MAGKHQSGLSTTPGLIHFNSNSGAQALNLAVLWGAKRLLLVGFDGGLVGGKDHFFGSHPKSLRNNSPYPTFVRNFESIAADCKRLGVAVVNTSVGSHIKAFPKLPLADALRA